MIIKLVTTSILLKGFFTNWDSKKAGYWIPSVKGNDQMSKIPKFGVPVTDEEYARKREQEP